MLKLTDLNIDCLDAMLNYLDLKDLLNAADANKKLEAAARFVYNRRYRQMDVQFQNILVFSNDSCHSLGIYPTKIYVEELTSCIQIFHLKTALRFLRCFGYLLKSIHYGPRQPFSNLDNYICKYISEFCSNTLISFNISTDESILEHFQKPFYQVEKIEIMSNIQEKTCLTRLFPKLRALTIVNLKTCTFQKGLTSYHFENLEYLDITSDNYGDQSECRENMITTLKLNPNLKYLRVIGCGISMKIFQTICASLQNLESLELIPKNNFFDDFDGKVVHLKSLKHLEVNFNEYSLIAGIGEMNGEKFMIPFSFDRLESLSLDALWAEHYYRIIEKNPTIRVLKIENIDNLNIDPHKLAKTLPFLEELEIPWVTLSIEDAMQFLSSFNSLQLFCFSLKQYSDYDRLHDRMNEEWEISIDGHFDIVVLERRINQGYHTHIF